MSGCFLHINELIDLDIIKLFQPNVGHPKRQVSQRLGKVLPDLRPVVAVDIVFLHNPGNLYEGEKVLRVQFGLF